MHCPRNCHAALHALCNSLDMQFGLIGHLWGSKSSNIRCFTLRFILHQLDVSLSCCLNALLVRYFTKLIFGKVFLRSNISRKARCSLVCRSYVQERHNCWDRMQADIVYQIHPIVCLHPFLTTPLQLPGPDITWLDQGF